MWIFTTFGFFSVVRKRWNAPHELTVRARARGDLVALKAELRKVGGLTPTIREDPHADYRFRIPVDEADFAKVMERQVLGIDYDNFKAEVSKRQGADRAHAYGHVWDVMYGLQQNEVGREQRPRRGARS